MFRVAANIKKRPLSNNLVFVNCFHHQFNANFDPSDPCTATKSNICFAKIEYKDGEHASDP